MSRNARLLLIWLAVIPLGLMAQGVAEICESLRQMTPYAGAARVTVQPAGADESIDYTVRLFSSAIPDTALAPSCYLIETTKVNAQPSNSFTALADGRFWRWDGQRLTERSLDDGTLTPAAARHAQFAELLPPFILADLQAISPADIEIEQEGPERLCLKATERYAGETVALYTLTLSLPSLTLLQAERATGIGTPAETSIRAVYETIPDKPQAVTAALVASRHADVIDRFGQENRTPESFIGYQFPRLTLPDSRGGRFTFRPGHETIVILLDDLNDPDALEEYTRQLRPLMSRPDLAPFDIVYVLQSRYADAIPASEAPTPRETILLGGSPLARDLGAIPFDTSATNGTGTNGTGTTNGTSATSRLPLAILIDSTGIVTAIRPLPDDPLPIIEALAKSL